MGSKSLISIEMRPASVLEAEVARSIMFDVAEWQKSLGQPMWADDVIGLPRILEAIARAELFLAFRGEDAVGRVYFQNEDQVFWPDLPKGEAAFVHKLAVKRSAGGQGISAQIMDWAKDEARRRGRRYLRLDCRAERKGLCDLYESMGFRRHSERQVDPYYVVRYEFALTD